MSLDDSHPKSATDAQDSGPALLALVQQLAREVNPAVGTLHLDSALEQDASAAPAKLACGALGR